MIQVIDGSLSLTTVFKKTMRFLSLYGQNSLILPKKKQHVMIWLFKAAVRVHTVRKWQNMQAQTHTHSPRHLQTSLAIWADMYNYKLYTPHICDVQWTLGVSNMNLWNVREHNLEAHFLCNRTGAPRQNAEWSSHLRKLRMPFFSKQWVKSIRHLS